ncbi:putative signal transducing protein [Dyella flagellata]|uniref:DUF2007 domain-containing protein n=1 Tax=Dyella flagellata TaxID=1867833 RepID=A0ABQ5XCV0_9GAMM|nr:DUF2007 domain-containing protein [Dyella flagellata]GLQ88365.1 hypothetical protein GCM10007898_19340 [Dyella flagellata]
MKANALTQVFADLTDEALLKRFNSGALTEEAEAIAKAEILSRGLSLPGAGEAERTDGEEAQEETPNEDLIPVARNLLPIDARVIQGRLEAEGIYAFVADENLMSALPIWAHAAYGGGARVLVRASQAEAAAKILAARRADEYQLEDEEGDS